VNLLAFLHKAKPPVQDQTNSASSCTESAFALQVRNFLFPSSGYTLLERTLVATELNDDRKPCANPAFKFLDQSTGKSFWLEVKSCSHDWSNRIHWCTEMQLQRYLSCHKKTPTFLLLSVDQGAGAPSSLYLLSMTQARYAYLLDACIRHFEISSNQPLSSAQLWSR
jgi:hypothetical protein